MLKQKVWLDQSGRFHNDEGKFTSIQITPEQYDSISSELHFYQKEENPQTYIRTGSFVDVDLSPDEIFARVAVTVTLGYIVVHGIGYFL